MPELDHTNRPVRADEDADTIIKVWRVAFDPSGEYDTHIIRGWQDMLDFVRSEMERTLERTFEDDEEEKASVTVKLVEMTREEYDDICENGR